MRLVGALIAVALLLAGCGGEDEPGAEATPTKQAGPQSFNTLQALRDAAVEAGYECPRWVQDNKVKLAAESGSCSDADVLATFASQADLEAQVATLREIGEMVSDPDPIVVGPNWIINGADSPDIAEALGGVVSR